MQNNKNCFIIRVFYYILIGWQKKEEESMKARMALPSFIEGIARLLDFGHKLPEYDDITASYRADYIAISSDWSNVGRDIKHSMRNYSSEQK